MHFGSVVTQNCYAIDLSSSFYEANGEGGIRTYGSGSENQALTVPGAQIDALKLRRSAELIEVFRSWWHLRGPLRAAVLAIMRTNNAKS